MIGIYPTYDSEDKFVGWEVWVGGTLYQRGLSIEGAGEVARKLTIKLTFEATLKNSVAKVEEKPVRRGIFLSKEHNGKWEVWEGGICVSVAYASVEEAAKNFDQNNLEATPTQTSDVGGYRA